MAYKYNEHLGGKWLYEVFVDKTWSTKYKT